MGPCKSKNKAMEKNDTLMSTIDHQDNLIDKVLQERNFNVYSVTEFGKFGPVINIKFLPMQNEIPVRIVEQEKIGKEELEWYNLYNDNILSLITIEHIEKIDVVLFYMEEYEYTLKEIITHDIIKSKEDGITKAIKWMTQIAEGLQYIHLKNFVHLNICTENIVITEKENAKITNFHYLCSRKAFSAK